MKLSYSTLACPDWSLEQCIEGAKKYGYEGLEIRLLDGELLPPDLSKAQRDRVKKLMQEAGLPVCCVDTSVCVAQPDPEQRAAQVKDGIAFLEMAAQWGAPCIRVFSGPPEGTEKPAAMAAASQALEAIARRGAELGVIVALETHDFFCKGVDMAEILSKVPSRFAAALWDIQHPIRYDEAPAVSMEAMKHRLVHTHVKDGHRPASGRDWPPALLGQGDVPVKACLDELKKGGYQGWISLEWEKKWHPEIEGPDVALPQYSKGLLEMIRAQ